MESTLNSAHECAIKHTHACTHQQHTPNISTALTLLCHHSPDPAVPRQRRQHLHRTCNHIHMTPRPNFLNKQQLQAACCIRRLRSQPWNACLKLLQLQPDRLLLRPYQRTQTATAATTAAVSSSSIRFYLVAASGCVEVASVLVCWFAAVTSCR